MSTVRNGGRARQAAVLVVAAIALVMLVAWQVTRPAAAAVPVRPVPGNSTPQPLTFTQDWTNAGLITANDDWSGVPGIDGFLGDDASTTTAGIDPRTIITPFVTIDVIANQTNPNTLTAGGVAEFDGIANRVVALQGSGTADFPHIIINVDTTGLSSIGVQYNVRDIDGSADNTNQQVNLQYRVGTSGTFTNVVGGYIADATTGPNLADLVTPVYVVLPSDADNQPVVQLRVMTSNAPGSDEWVGIDDISIFAGASTATPTSAATATPTATGSPATSTATASATATVGPGTTRIRDIQGAAHLSPMSGTAVLNVPGIVTGRVGNGFYMQDPLPDANNATSEGIFVFTSSAPTVNVGDSVLVSGNIAEFRQGGASSANLTLTEITQPSVTLSSSGNPLPSPVLVGTGGRIPPNMVYDDDAGCGDVELCGTFDPDTDGIDYWESLEGMRIQVNNAVVVGPTAQFTGGLPNREVYVIGDNGANANVRTTRGGLVIRQNDFNPERIIISNQFQTVPDLNVNDMFTQPVVGPLGYNFGKYLLHATSPLSTASGGLTREVTGIPGTNELTLANFNVENLSPLDPPSKFANLAGLIVTNMKSPDLIAVEEVQDNTGPTDDGVVAADVTWNTLISAIQSAGGPTYSYRQIDPVNNQDGGQPGGNIRQGFLFRTDRGLQFVDRPGGGPITPTQVLSDSGGPRLQFSPGRIDPLNPAFNSSRKPLAGEFLYNGRKLFVVANHFNSKGGDDPLFGRRQPPILSSEAQRNQQATIVANFASQIFGYDPAALVSVAGDLNDYEFSNPLNILRGVGFTPLIETLPLPERYSYVFQGNSQSLDHVLASPQLLAANTGYDAVHVNSEFAVQDSDHDPEVATFLLPPASTPTTTPSSTATTTNTALPTSTSTATRTHTALPTHTGTATATRTSTVTATTPPSSTSTSTSTRTSTVTATTPPSSTPTASATRTSTAMPSATPTRTYTVAPSSTTAPSFTATPTRTASATAPVATSTPTSQQPTSTRTSTGTATSTAVATNTVVPATATATACPIEFTDVPPGSTFYAFVRCLACRGIVNGYSSGCETGDPCFRPGNMVTRGQVAKIVSNAAGFVEPVTAQSFEDVPPGHTFYDYIGRLATRGYINGYACGGAGEPCVPPLNLPYYRPGVNVSRGQLSKIVSNAAQFNDVPSGQQFEDVAPGSTFYPFIYRLYIRNIMSGYACGGDGEPCVPPLNLPYFRPGASATRGQTAKIVANTFFPNCQTPAR